MFPRKLSFSKMDPSCAIGFYCRTRSELDELLLEIPKVRFYVCCRTVILRCIMFVIFAVESLIRTLCQSIVIHIIIIIDEVDPVKR